ncbi:winged helix-turn-helix transcriptional regulator [Thermosipho ferrireducens]|uniref:Winged helix-turn-helix transcriptional regulator n=1 Tax=Thermosipho ferrireducens TaxID=2571116 RepID=A0ABX7S4P7_9BACT|nr:winged helix-turn-helix transcriptional regulator [Thermosipho ferrireducens]QTA37407.1 winged helix-turn-helix transcriptional regulator [Thermosipho ferrireducens]
MIKLKELHFFIPSTVYRKLLILSYINKNQKASQMEISQYVGIVPSLVNKYIADFEKDRLLVKRKEGKHYVYELTLEGLSEMNYLRLLFFDEISKLYGMINSQLENIFLKLKGKKLIGIYGAGLVGNILADLLSQKNYIVSVFFDDDIEKIGNRINGIPVVKLGDFAKIEALVIASFKNGEKMVEKALKKGYRDIYRFKIEEDFIKLIWVG